jgi:C-terminal processing protease CtpA/Prc
LLTAGCFGSESDLGIGSPDSSGPEGATTSTPSIGTETPTTSDPVGAADYLEYVETALAVMESYYYASPETDWQPIRETALEGLDADPSPAESYRSIDDALSALGDPHSVFWPPRARQDAAVTSEDVLLPSGERIGPIGYLNLPGDGTANLDPDRPKLYADRVNQLLEVLDSPEAACGWIVDLRENSGGWISNMFAGLGALLGEGVVLTATGPAGTQTIEVKGDLLIDITFNAGANAPTVDSPLLEPWTFTDATEEQTQDLVEATQTPSASVYRPQLPHAPVAVLISGATASAAEYLTIAFLGREDTETFGQTTFGVPTARGTFQFTDGGVLGLAVLAPADRVGRTYTSNIFPDTFVGPSPPGDDATLDAAVEWLSGHRDCS